ncbi:MAG: peptidylprolyl isomerase [Acidobacteriota bacterium]
MLFISLILVSLIACGSEGPATDGPSSRIIAQVGDRQVPSAAFDAYLVAGLGDPQEVAAASAAVKSRLLDQFLEEEMLVAAAQAAGISVSDDEIQAFLPGNKGDIDRARRVLLERKYKEVILKGVSVSEQEIVEYFNRNLSRFRRPARVVFRKILLDSAHEARSVRADLARHEDAFEQIAATRSLSPDGGKPEVYEEASLPDSIQRAIAKLKPGEISPVVEDAQGFFIVRLERRQAESSQTLEEVRDEIELALLRSESQRRYEESLRALRGGTRVTIYEDRLGFSYMKKGES